MGTHPIFESDFDCLTENMKLKWGLVLGAAAIAQECVDPAESYKNVITSTFGKKDCTNFGDGRTCFVKCIEGHRQALPIPVVRERTLIKCTCENGACDWVPRKDFGNCVPCLKANKKAKSAKSHFRVLRDLASTDLFEPTE